MDERQFIFCFVDNADMRYIQTFNRCHETYNVSVVYLVSMGINFIFRNEIMTAGIDLFFFLCNFLYSYAVSFQLFVAVRMRRHERNMQWHSLPSNFFVYVFYT